eukprot:CAMPEP_0185588102 /NCGR_PEP_ID=MMETSP0434-20130131/51876_1 /TAXON_ID=626734 ORGANISM="Favella taraikaensis, Strain Fe Narragansett Bay" /NCGR_SAMPLE_ID=MMETSP0434 /ASSEMBLY_ACC=CAM_ASM_000379 /LENGTH=44 /DNA_ID= /DNA_START= /DNA_END= /DNA_ORIENTATION=
MKFGAYDFIEKCEQIVENNDKIRLKEQAMEERASKRTKMTMNRV